MSLNKHTFTGTGVSKVFNISGDFNVSLLGFGTATVDLERSLDGVNWGVLGSFTANKEHIAINPTNASFRFNCSAYTSGTIVCIAGEKQH